jgi:hypothetical protein
VRQNEFACPHCGFETGFAPLTITACMGANACPMCGQLLPAVAMGGPFDTVLWRMEHENPTLCDYLVEKMNQRAARQRTARWIAALAASLLTTLAVYLLFRLLL